MVLPKLKAELLAAALGELSHDDGPRLAEILAELRLEVAREPGNLIASVAYNHALGLAGKAEEAQAEALRALDLLTRLPAVSPLIRMHVGVGLRNAGQFEQALRCLDPLLARDDLGPEGLQRLVLHIRGTLLRSGDLSAGDPREFAEVPEYRFLQDHSLLPWWSRQQRAVERALQRRTTSVGIEMTRDEDDAPYLVLDYYTDADSPEQLDELDAAVSRALDCVYADHPSGYAALAGKVVFAVHGPEIPLPPEAR